MHYSFQVIIAVYSYHVFELTSYLPSAPKGQELGFAQHTACYSVGSPDVFVEVLEEHYGTVITALGTWCRPYNKMAL
jgi:hypothetical protein